MKKTIITIVSLVAVLFVVAYAYEFIFNKPIIESPTIEQEQFPTQKVEVKEQYKGTTYTFAGSLDVPTPCHTLSTKTNKISDTKYQIELITGNPKEGVVCAQVISPKTYKVSFDAPKDIVVTILVNGVEYETNRFLVPNDQNIDTFNLEIKG
jgi:hypothetical protein